VPDAFEMGGVDRVTVGTVGVPGRRTFYLQARQGDRRVDLKLEKQQVAALAQLLGELLADLPAPADLPTDLDLEEPVTPAWAVGTMQLAYDGDADRVVLVAEEIDDDEGSAGRMLVTREQAAALVARAAELVEAGRPPCHYCGHPLDPSGHSCPRMNGHRPPAL
jgi:uncharacterized repeat protein (TIGR03847 family)